MEIIVFYSDWIKSNNNGIYLIYRSINVLKSDL